MASKNLVTRVATLAGGVHPSAQGDELTALRHASFIATHLIGGGLAALSLIAYVLITGGSDALIVVALVWLTIPIGLAAILILTGRLLTVHILSAAHHSLLVSLVAAFTGGLSSFVIPWIIVVPVEAALSGKKQVIAVAFALSLIGVAVLIGLGFTELLPVPRELEIAKPILIAGGLITAGLYACLVAMAVEVLSRRSEDAARDSTAHYRLMADNATDLISVHDVNGRATFVSEGAARLFGHAPDDLFGQGFLGAVSIAERPAFIEAVCSAALQGRETVVTYQFGSDSDGRSPVWVETRCRPISGGQHAEAGQAAIVAVTRDVSLARAREDQLRAARDAAESASRSKSRFLANVSHELRTPLNAIIGFSSVLVERLSATKPTQQEEEFARLIGESGTHLLSIVNDLLDMSRIEANRYEINRVEVSIADIFAVCTNMMATAAEDGEVTVLSDVGDPPINTVADHRALRQIVLNLLSNAIKFSNPGGTVTLSAREIEGAVELSVADEGIGIEERDLDRLGEPFVQAESDYDRKYEGAGLGLSVVKGLVALHGGELRISSVVGQGTTAVVRLPSQDLNLQTASTPLQEINFALQISG